MKYFLLALILAPLLTTAQVNWMSMDEALAAQEKEPRKILLKTYTDWCANCKWMDKYAFAKADIATYINKNYYPVAFNAEGNTTITYKGKTYSRGTKKRDAGNQHDFAEYLGILEYPTLVFFNERGDVINPVPGKLDARKLEIYITMLSDDTYKKIRTGRQWSDYQKNFTYKLQD